MTSNMVSHARHNEGVGSGPKSHSQIELCPALRSLEEFANKKYDSYRAIAESFDDAQAEFTSKAVNFLQGNDLLARVALRSAELAQKKQ